MRGWVTKTLGEACELVNGGTPKTGVAEFWGGQHQWVTPAEMGKRSSPYIDATERTLTDAGLANCSASPLPLHSVIMSSRAPIGHLVINTVPMSFNQGCKGLIPKPGLDHKFLYYFLLTNVELLNALGTGATFKELSGGKLKEVTLPIPPLAEQKRIVAILDEAFEGIAKATANAERNLANARELFDNRVAVLFAFPAESWRRTKLDEVCDAFEYGTSAKSKKTGKIPVLRMGNIQSGALDWTDLVYANNEVEAARYELVDGDVLFNRTNSAEHVGKAAIFRSERKAIFAGYLIRIRYKRAQIDGEFLNYYLNSPFARNYGRSVMAQSVNQANISGSKLKEYPFLYPDIEEQVSIAAELRELQANSAELADLYQRKIHALSELKKTLLRKAFSGQLTGKETIAA